MRLLFLTLSCLFTLAQAQVRQPYSSIGDMWANMPPKTPPAALEKANDLAEWLPGNTILLVGRSSRGDGPKFSFFGYILDAESYELLGQRYNLKLNGNLLCALECYSFYWDKAGRLVAYYYFYDRDDAWGVTVERGKGDLYTAARASRPDSYWMVPKRSFIQNLSGQ